MTSQAEQISPRDNLPNRIESQTQNDGLAQARVFDLTEFRNAVNAAGNDNVTLPPGFPNGDLIIGNTMEQPKQPGNKLKDDTGSGDAHRNESGNAYRNDAINVNRNESGDTDRNEGNPVNDNKIDGAKPPTDFELHFQHRRLDLPKAVAKLDALIDPSLPPRDQGIMRDLNAAILTGDSHGLADTIARFKGPEELRRFTRMLNENLQQANSGIGATVQDNSLLILGTGNRGVQISHDGRASVRELELNRDGTVRLGDHIHTESPSVTMDMIGRQARFHMAMSELQRIPKTPAEFRPTR